MNNNSRTTIKKTMTERRTGDREREREEPIHMLIVEWLALNNVKYHD